MLPQPLWPAPGETRIAEDPTLKYLSAVLMVREDCQVLRELDELREMGWQSGTMHEHFEHQRYQNDDNKQNNTNWFWPNKVYKSMQDMDLAGRFVVANRFLDIGCFSGGYSSYVMHACPKATGMGISLPVEDGGLSVMVPEDLLPRIDLVMHDHMTYDLTTPTSILNPDKRRLSALPFKPHTFDFVICSGSHIRPTPDSVRRPWDWTRLMISQLLLGLRAIGGGGTMFIKLSHVERPLTARILLALCRITNHVRTIKSWVIHRSRASFYVLAQGVRTSCKEYTELVSGLERLWYILNFEGEGYGREITWEEQDNVTPWNEVMSPLGVLCIVRLGTKVWQTQRDGLRQFLEWKGVNTTANWREKEAVASDGRGIMASV
ncbi:hypothetical protein FRC12_010742 [Ceratobasidium sp. 428]|nr:hypothetical protein FRC12_010742 [Ceratobasidium sp. 428]